MAATSNSISSFLKKGTVKSALIFCLTILLGLIWTLNCQPYITAAEKLWGIAGVRNENSSIIHDMVFDSFLTKSLWTLFGVSLCVGLQLLEFLPALNYNITRKKARLVRALSYLIDLAILWVVYPVDTLPPNWWHVILILLALGAVEAIFYPLALVKNS